MHWEGIEKPDPTSVKTARIKSGSWDPALALRAWFLPHLFVGLQIPLELSQESAMTPKHIDKYPLLLSQELGNFLGAVKNDSIKLAKDGFAAIEPGHSIGAARSLISTPDLLQLHFRCCCRSLTVFGLN